MECQQENVLMPADIPIMWVLTYDRWASPPFQKIDNVISYSYNLFPITSARTEL